MRWLALGASATAGMLLGSGTARAGDVWAKPCPDDQWYCQRAPIHYDETDSSPVELDFDTGWVPPNSDLQVHLWGKVFATTRVQLRGALETRWPEALTLTAPGDAMGGWLGYHYGVDIGAQGKITVTIANQTQTWTGDLPYVPQVDFQVEGGEAFDAWGWDPGHTVSDSTLPVRVAEVDLLGLVTSIPGLSGGFALDVAIDADITYVNERIVIRTTDGATIDGGDIIAKDDDTNAIYAGEPSVIYDVHPEGKVLYGGVLHLIPSFYIEILNQNQSIPIADIPIDLPVTERDWTFEPERVTIGLPDLELEEDELDFGIVTLGDEKLGTYPVHNAGDMAVTMTITVSDEDNFPLWDDELDVEPGETVNAALRFEPQQGGEHTAKLTFVSSDPDEPEQTMSLRGEGVGIAPPVTVAGASPEAAGGCGCRVAGERDARGAWPLLLFGLALSRRRRRR